jgi:hypothetical protein
VKYSKFLLILIAIQPVLDVITLFIYRSTGDSMGILVRGSISLLFIIYTFFLKNNYLKEKINFLALLLMLFVFYFTANTYIYGFSEIAILDFIRMAFFPLILYFLYLHRDLINIQDITKGLKISIFIIILTFILATITNSYEYSYRTSALGNNGWFYAANETGAILSMLFPFAFMLFINKKTFLNLFLSMGLLIPILLIEVKSTVFTVSIVFIIFMINHTLNFIFFRVKKSNLIILVILYIFLSLSIYLIPMIPAYQTFLFRYRFVFGNESFLFVLFGGREKLVIDLVEVYINNFPASFLIGVRSIAGIVEMDFIDILFGYGIFVTLFLAYIFRRMLQNFPNFSKLRKDSTLQYALPVIIGISISILIGHVVFAPAVSFYLAIFMIANKVYIDTSRKENKNESKKTCSTNI